MREIGPGGDQDQARWVPTYPTSHPQLVPQAYKMPYEPPQAAASFGSRPIDRGDTLGPTTQYQLPAPTTHPELERHTYEGYRIADEHAVVASSDDYEGDDTYNHGDPPPTWFHTQPPPLDAQPPDQPPDHDGYDPTSDHGPYTTPFDDHEHEGGASAEPDHDAMIEQLGRELFASGNPGVNWAEEMDNMGLQGEYYYPPTTYSAPPPVPPSPTPWVPPPPPTPAYRPPKAQFPPHHGWYDPSRTQDRPRRAPYHPRTRPAPRRHPRLETRRRHVTVTRPVRNRERPHSNEDGPPQYIPPALRGEDRTPRRSHLPKTHSSKHWRDSPLHKDLPQSPRPSDSPDWRAPSPNRPTSFRSPSPPPPQSSPPSPVPPTHTPKMLSLPQSHHTEFQAIPELFLIIKTASSTLQSIIRIAEKLIHQVNAERRLAHKPQKVIWGLRVDALA